MADEEQSRPARGSEQPLQRQDHALPESGETLAAEERSIGLLRAPHCIGECLRQVFSGLPWGARPEADLLELGHRFERELAVAELRVAEETALLDHMSGGRHFVGFARGYQSRWTEVLGQHIGNRATLSAKDEADRINREIFEESVQMVLDAWTQESIEHKSDRWQIPFPHDQGIPGYFTPIDRARAHGQTCVDVACSAGREFALGQNQMVVRWLEHGNTPEEARANVAAHNADIFKHFYGPFFDALGRSNVEGEKLAPLDATPQELIDPILDTGLWISGTVDQMREQFIEQWKVLPAEYMMWVTHFAQQPKESIIHNMEVFMKEVKPVIDELIEY